MTATRALRDVHIEAGCIACGQCEQLVPEVFRVPAGGTSRVLEAWAEFLGSSPGAPQRLLGARDACPVDVIRVDL